MILHPGILALIIGSAITLLMLLYAAVTGGIILKRWDYHSSSSSQLAMERKTYLVSTLVNYALGFQVASFVLFIYTMDDIHRLFVGAMCATGSLNANPVGWYALFSKMVAFFLSGFWIALNHVDQSSEQYPLIKIKYRLLFVVLPFIMLDFSLQLAYFLGLEPDIITSCCGSLFGGNSTGTITIISALPVLPTMVSFYTICIFFLAVMGLNLFLQKGSLRYSLLLCSTVFFALSFAAIISFVSIYIYELPMHHCPFDILQRGYYFIGYPIYLTLFAGVFCGMLPGLFQPFKNIDSLKNKLLVLERKWVQCCIVTISIFIALVSYSVWASNLVYFS